MKKLVFLLFTLYCGLALGQKHTVIVLTDSAFLNLDSGWVYSLEDKPEMAAKEYNDASWKTIVPSLYLRQDTSNLFKGKGWFRFHVYADSSTVKIPMAFLIDHSGASELYFDGKLIKKWGLVKDKDSSEYYNPKGTVIPFVIDDTGKHVIAVHYANYDAAKNFKHFRYASAGFELAVGTAAQMIAQVEMTSYGSYVSIFLFSLFASISLVHFLLFLYYRTATSNLFFSILALGSGLLFLYSFINLNSGLPSIKIFSRFLLVPIVCLVSFSLSGVINTVFPEKGKWRFRIIAAFALLVTIFSLFNLPMLAIGVFVLIGVVSLEAVVKIIIAVIKRKKGSRIIGLGFFLFVFFILTIMLLLLISGGNFDINDDTLMGRILLLTLVFSMLSVPLSMSTFLAKNFATVSRDLKKQLEQVKLLSDKTLEQEQEKQRLLENRKEELEKEVQLRTVEVITQKDKIEKQHSELVLEKKKSDDLLLNILPTEVAEELKLKGTSEARYFTDVTVLFTDFVNFTKVSEQLSPQELVSEIHGYFRVFDEIIGQFGLEKIKTIGDAYLAVCGLPEPNTNHAVNTVKAAIAIRDYILERKEKGGLFEIRLGLNSGPVVAGIVGVKKFAYDIWGDTVNTAARMEQHSEAGKINISGSTYELVSNDFQFINRGKIDAKNKGMIDMYFVV